MTLRVFKNSKRFWQFYSAHVKVKSDKTSHTLPSTMRNGNITAAKPIDIANLFNNFFTSLSSESDATLEECSRFAVENVRSMLDSMKIPPNQFSFRPTTVTIVEKYIKSLWTGY
jgi:hypothetical protein